MELQQRDRKGNKGEEQTREEHIANFEPGYLLADPKTDSGAMVVARRPGPDGKPQLVVVSGNGRTMVLEEMAKRNLYDRYRNRMKEWAKENGVENTVADADNPVLVRVVDELGGATLKELADLSNTNAIQQMNEEEQARADADLVRSLDLAKLYKPNMDGSANMAAGASDDFFREFVRATGDTSLLNSDGTFTEALRMRARRALLAIACGQGERGRDVVKKLVEDTDALGIDRQKDAAAAIAPHVAAIEARPEYAIGPDVSRAFADYIEFRENRDTGKKWGTLEEYLKQGDMLDPRSEIAESVMRLLDDPKNAPVLSETVRLYAEAAKGETDGLFGAARTRAEIWRDVEKAVDEKAVQDRARSEGAFKPETRFSIRSGKDAKDEEKKETTAQGPLSKSDQTPPVQFSGGATSIPLTPESADPVKKFADSISQDGLKSPADFLAGLVHVLGSTETNPDKTQYFDIAHEDGRTMSLRVANHRATAGQYREHGNTADVKTSIVVKMSDKPFKADADVELTEHVYFSDKLTAEREAAIASGVADWIRTGEWHGPAADQVNMSPHRRFSIAGRAGAENMGIGGMAEAEAMEKAGKDREEIWRTTGWWRGKDGKWRVELPSMRFKPDMHMGFYERAILGNKKVPLSDIVDAPELFKAYPELKELPVRAEMMESTGRKAYFDTDANEIVLNKWAYSRNETEVLAVMSHEIQHKIQELEGFAKGGNTSDIEHARELNTSLSKTVASMMDKLGYQEWLDQLTENKALIETSHKASDKYPTSRFPLERKFAEDMGGESGKRLLQKLDQADEIYADNAKEAHYGRTIQEAYRSISGEVEARNASRREAMTPEERAATPPWATEDVPADRQIVRYSLKAGTATDYSWATLTAKPDMQLAQIDPEKFKNYTDDSQRLDDARKSVLAAGGRIVNGSYVIDMDGSPVVVGGAGILHKYRKPNLENDMLFPILGEVLKKSICVNELNPRPKDKTIKNVFVYLGAFAYNNEICPVRIQVNQMRGIREIDRIDVLHSLNTKIGAVASPTGVNSGFNVPLTPAPGTAAAFGGLAPAYQPLPTISIADLVRIAQPLHPQIFSRDVAAALGVTYRGGELGARYSVTARTPSDEIKADPESFARQSVVSRVIDGDAEERESALVAFVAERALRHGPRPNAFKTIARLGLEMGLKTVEASRIIQKGEALADRVRGTVIEKAIRKGDVATATALLARESDIDRLVAGAAGQGGQLVRAGEGKIKSFLDREIEKHIRSFNAASLADVERDTGIDIAGEILANSPERFDPKGSAKREEAKAEAGEAGGEEGAVPGAGAPDEGNITDFERARRERVRKEAEERVAKMIATAKQRAEEAEKQRAEWEAKRDERKRQAEAAAAAGEAGEAGGGAGGGGEGGGGGGETVTPERPKLSTFADFKTPEEFAAFFRVWAEERYKKEHGASTLGKHEEKRLFPEFYRKAVVRKLQDLADKLLPPKGARATVNRWLGEIQPGVKPDTLERISADIFKYINRNAIRESRTEKVKKFCNGIDEFLSGRQFDDLKLDADRKVTGFVEESARYIKKVCQLSNLAINGKPSALEEERARLEAILNKRSEVYDDEGKIAADAPQFDMETRRALHQLQLLEKYGAMKRYMPGQIEDLANEAMTWLRDEAGKLEANWKSARETEESIRAALVGGIVGPNGQKYQRDKGIKGWADRLFDSMNGMIRLRLQRLVRFADSASQQKAREAINRIMVMLGDGEVEFTRHTQNDSAAYDKALTTIFTDRATGRFDRRACADWLNRMTEAIPTDLSRQLSKQGYADSMTYGQMLQLLVSLEQKSYAEAISANKRDGQADLIRTFETIGPDGRRERVLTDKDILFIDWLRSFYEAKRTQLSEVTKRMTGLPIDSPDPLYCPVKMYMGDRARGMHVDDTKAWDPIGAVFSRRVETLRDFDESASILGQFFDRSAEAAKLEAWGERGSIIRGVFTNASVQESIRRAFGGGELSKILKQLEQTFNGGESVRKSPGEIAAADTAMNWTTYLSLGYNPLSAMKQTTSIWVWANALPGGFKDLWRYMRDVDMATIKHIKESEAYKVRYGNEVGSGQDVATKGLNAQGDNPSENPVKKFFKNTSMWLLKKGDFLPGGWIAQGLFRDLYNRHLKEGMDPQAADRLAMTETFNMLEETQQSGRTYNTHELAREHGRVARLLVQFATSPLQQLQWETQALREVWDLQRYKPATPDADFEKRYSEAKGKLVRAAVINHVLLPAGLHAVTDIFRLIMGQDPEWEQEGWHFTLFRDVLLGQASRIFFLGTFTSTLYDGLVNGKFSFGGTDLLPIEGQVRMAGQIGKTAHDITAGVWHGITAKDFAEGFDYEKVQKDLHRLLRSTSITRTPYDVIRLLSGKAYAEREERREKRRQKEEKAAAKQK